MGAVGLMVHALGDPGDLVIGKRLAAEPFAGRHYQPVPNPLWPPFGAVARYYAGVLAALRRLRPTRVEIHNRADLAHRAVSVLPHSSVALFLHNDPQSMRGARRPDHRARLLERTQVICVSDYLRARFMSGLPDSIGSGALLLHNSIDLAALPPPLPPPLREPLFLFAGRIVSDKGADAFVRAARTVLRGLPGWRAAMIGADRFHPEAPDTPFLRKLRPEAEQAGIGMLGYRPRAAVMEAMARAAVMVVPSRWAEPFGLVALEAMANGAALICSAKGGLREVAGEAALYADPDVPGSLEAAMTRLGQDAALRAALSAAGQERARRFDIGPARAALGRIRASGGQRLSLCHPLGP